MKTPKIIIPILALLALLCSCTHTPTPPEGMLRHNLKEYRYYIDYPKGECDVSTERNGGVNVFTIASHNNDYIVDVLALNASDENRYKFDKYATLDTAYFTNLPAPYASAKDWWSDNITRQYHLTDNIDLKTVSIYGGDNIYCLFMRYTPDGEAPARAIAESFRTSSGRGFRNFCDRKLMGLIGDNIFTSILSYVAFTLLFTIVFWWCGAAVMDLSKSQPVNVILFVAFLFLFGLFALYDHFLGYWYGHENLFTVILSYVLMFFGDD